MTIQTIIFSKDRPLQLHATLSSFELHEANATEMPITVLFCASDPSFLNGYTQLAEEFANRLQINWLKESRFKEDLLSQFLPSSRWTLPRRIFHRLTGRPNKLLCEFVLFLVDDNIFVRPFSLSSIANSLYLEPHAIGFSLRVGRNTVRCYSMNCEQPLPNFEQASLGLIFHWPGQVGDFGYPLEVSSSVYRSADLIPLLRRLPYSNPNRLEQGLSAASGFYSGRYPRLLCYDQSVAFCAPVNKVQTFLDNRAGDSQLYTSESLNQLFLKGCRVDVSALSSFVPEAAHVEIELPLIMP